MQVNRADRIRAHVIKALADAGPAGCSLAELCSGKDKRATRWSLNESKTKICVRAMTRSTSAIRYFGLDFADAAAAYLAAQDAREKRHFYLAESTAQKLIDACKGGEDTKTLARAAGITYRTASMAISLLSRQGRIQRTERAAPRGGTITLCWPAGVDMPPKPPPKKRIYAGRKRNQESGVYAKGSIKQDGRKMAVMALLTQNQAGMHLVQLAHAMGLSPSTIATVCCDLARAGMILGLRDPSARASARRRYCMPEHVDVAREQINSTNRALPAAKGKASLKQLTGPVDMSRAKLTVAPTPKPRFHIDKPEPFFSAGKRIEADTWAARAYA
jgi:hypothetical protein